MLPIRVLSKGIRNQITLPAQWLSFTTRLKSNTTASSSSSSDSSSDEDQKAKQKEKMQKETLNAQKVTDSKDTTEQKLHTFHPVKQIDFAIKKKIRKEKQKQNRQPYEKQLNTAAEDVANQFDGRKEKVKGDLLSKLMLTRKESSPIDLNKLLETDKDTQQQSKSHIMDKKLNILRSAASQRKQNDRMKQDGSFTGNLKPRQQFSIKTSFRSDTQEEIISFNNIVLFEDIVAEKLPTDVPQLETWNALQEREMKSLVNRYPMNPFQELIQWTEEGKLWHFPIDNEQGMEEEHSVHFSEHVFLDQHLEGWCPTKGPIRHFMELVCVGLSKNPYMTASEKLEHINWYKDYFNANSNILKEVGAIETAG